MIPANWRKAKKPSGEGFLLCLKKILTKKMAGNRESYKKNCRKKRSQQCIQEEKQGDIQ
jgi:hypothetical protein